MTSEPSSPPSFSTGRRFGAGFNVFVSAVAALAVLVMVNYLSARHYHRFQWANGAQPPLSPLTLRLLHSLTNDVKVVVFFDTDPESSLYQLVAGSLSEYQSASPHIVVETIDSQTDPTGAKRLQARYPLIGQKDKDLIVFEWNGRVKVVRASELSDYDTSKLISGQSKEVPRTAFRGEMLFSSALAGLLDPNVPKAYFLQGHAEHDPDNTEQSGYSEFAALLKEKNIVFEKLIFSGAQGVPADCGLLVIAAPEKPFSPAELQRVDEYLEQGGRLLLLAGYVTYSTGHITRSGLERVLAKWGVALGNNVVVDLNKQNQVAAGKEDLIEVREFSAHPIVSPLARTSILLAGARSVAKLGAGRSGPDAAKVEALALTSSQGATRSEFSTGVPRADSALDYEGAIPVAVAVEKGKVQGVTAEHGATRMVVVGDAEFLSNYLIDQEGNRDFASLAVNWLLDRSPQFAEIGPRAIKEFTLVVSVGQMRLLQGILLVGFPGAVMACGLIVWLRRRH